MHDLFTKNKHFTFKSQIHVKCNSCRQEEKECRAQLLEAKATIMMYEKELRDIKSGEVEVTHPSSQVETVTREIQTDVHSPTDAVAISEENLSDRISREKEKLGGMMDDLKHRIHEIEQSRRLKEVEASDVTIAESVPSEAKQDEVP